MDAILGFINIQQNDLFKILTIVSVVGVPPTILVGIWGMNFKGMPELNWSWGYPFAWLAILGSLGVRTQPSWAGIFFQAQLGKYIPGSVWQYASRAAVARRHGIVRRIRAARITRPVCRGARAAQGVEVAGSA